MGRNDDEDATACLARAKDGWSNIVFSLSGAWCDMEEFERFQLSIQVSGDIKMRTICQKTTCFHGHQFL